MNQVVRALLLRCLLVAIGASLAGWSLNHALARDANSGLSVSRVLESIALFVGLALVWMTAMRPSSLGRRAPRWQRFVVEGIPALLALAVFGTFMAPLLT